VFIGKELILSDHHLTANSPQDSTLPPGDLAYAGSMPSNYPTSASPAWCCCGPCWWPSRNSRRWRARSKRTPATAGGSAGLLAFPRYWLGVFAQFAYVGAQVGVSFVIRYTQFNTPGTAEKVAATC
jgi:hypothetical protein